jgi:hypothetical protein
MFFEDYPIDFKVFARMVSRHSFCEVLSRPALRDFDMCCRGDRRLGDRSRPCYKSEVFKIIEQWQLFKYVGLEFTPLSKPFKTREQAEKAREKYPERLRKRIGLSVIRIKR